MKLLKKIIAVSLAASLSATYVFEQTVSADYYGNIQTFTGATINADSGYPTGWVSATGSTRTGEITSGLYGLSADDSLFKIISTASSGAWGTPPVYANRVIANLKTNGVLNETETLIDGSYYHLTAMVAACDDDFYNLGLYAHKVKVNYTPVGGSAANTGDIGTDGPILGFVKDGDRSTVKLEAWGEDITPVGFEFKTKTWYTLDVIFNGISNTMDTYLNGEFVKTVELSDNISAAAAYNDTTAYSGWHLYMLKYIGVMYERYNQTAWGAAAVFDNVGFGNYYYKSITKPVISTPTSNINVNGGVLSGETLKIGEGTKVSDINVTGNPVTFIDSLGNIKSGDVELVSTDRMAERVPVTVTATDTVNTYTDNETVVKYYYITVFSTALANAAVQSLNNSTSLAEFSSALMDSSDALGIETGNEYDSVLEAVLYKNRPYADYNDFIEKYSLYKLYAKICIGDMDNARMILENNADMLGVELDETYNLLSAAGQNILLAELIKADYINCSFDEIYRNAYLLAAFKSAEDHVKLRSVLTEYKSEYGIDISEADKCANPAGVFKKLMGTKGGAENVSDVASLFNTAVTNELAAEAGKASRVFDIKYEGYGNQMILVVKSGESLNDISDTVRPVHIEPLIMDGKGIHSIEISSDVESGFHDVYAGTTNEVYEIFVPDADAANNYIKETLNKSETAQSFKQAILAAANVLGIKSEEISDYADTLSEMLYAKKPFTDYVSFRAAYESCDIYARLGAESLEGVEKILQENEQELGIDFAVTYGTLNSVGQKLMLGELKKGNYVVNDFNDVYKKAYLFAAFRTADYYPKLKAILNTYAGDYGISIAAASVCNNPDGVYQILMDTKDSAYSISDVSVLYSSAIASELEKERKSVKVNGSTGGSGGGGGGGGGGGTGITIISTPDNASSNEAMPQQITNIGMFADMTGYEWANEAVEYLKNKGVINGVSETSFEPGRSVTRAEFAKMIALLLKIDGGRSTFADVSETDWYYKYVSSCAEKGLIEGDGVKFYPDKPIKREDAAVILSRALSNKELEFGSGLYFIDSTDISEYAISSVDRLSSIGVVQGDDQSRFLPQNSLTRAEAVVLLYKISKII